MECVNVASDQICKLFRALVNWGSGRSSLVRWHTGHTVRANRVSAACAAFKAYYQRRIDPVEAARQTVILIRDFEALE